MRQSTGVSVVLPIYGNFDIKRALISIDSLRAQKGVDVEIIVSEQGEVRRFPQVEGIKHIFTYHKQKGKIGDFNPGKVRNIAIMNSTKDYIYTIDADIILPEPFFLKKLMNVIKRNPRKVLFRPFMKRLPRDNFGKFDGWYARFGFAKAIKKLVINQEFLVKTSSKYRKMKVFEKISKEAGYKKTFTSFIEDYKKYVAERLGSDTNLNFWPLYWNENRHCGSNFFSRKQFLKVGGYCEKFVNWGCEDSDLQWKFREKYKLQFFPKELWVIHLDHPRGYISPKMWGINEKRSAKRKKRGADLAILADKRILLKEYE